MKIKWSASLLSLILILSFTTSAMANNNGSNTKTNVPPALYFDNQIWQTTESPVNVKGTFYLPARTLLSKFGLAVRWNGTTKVIEAKNDDYSVTLSPSQNKVSVNDEERTLNPNVIIEKSVTWLPVRAISQLFDYTVIFDRGLRILSLAPANDQTILPVLLHIEALKAKNASAVPGLLDGNAWAYEDLIENTATEIEANYAYEIEDIGVLEVVKGRAEVGVTIIRSKPGDSAFQPISASYIYRVKWQKNDTWRVYDVLPNTEADQPDEPPTAQAN